MKTLVVPNQSDNYSYLLIDTATNKAAAFDTFDVGKVKAAAEKEGVEIVANLTTHHHRDHSGGNEEFAKTFPGVPIYGGDYGTTRPKLTKLIKDKDEFMVGDSLRVKCLHTPCHTQDSICYYVIDTSDTSAAPAVFTGDTLFVAGCGRFFEGGDTGGQQMHDSLSYLGTLPEDTTVYVGHEYTGGNLAFTKSVDPSNPAVTRLEELVKENKVTTGVSTIGDEKEWNPFMRLTSQAVKGSVLKALSKDSDAQITESEIMDKLREMKNNYRG